MQCETGQRASVPFASLLQVSFVDVDALDALSGRPDQVLESVPPGTSHQGDTARPSRADQFAKKPGDQLGLADGRQRHMALVVRQRDVEPYGCHGASPDIVVKKAVSEERV